jgi:hypothetical protein
MYADCTIDAEAFMTAWKALSKEAALAKEAAQ